MKQKTLFIIVAVGLLLAFVAGVMFYKDQKEHEAAQLAESNRAALIRPHSPTLGRADAPVIIVEFFDPACGTCRDFYPLVKQLIAENPDQIRLVMRYTPFHNGSDQVVTMLQAANKQDKFWLTLEAMLATQDDWVQHHTAQVSQVWKHLEGLGLDFDKMLADMPSPEFAQVIERDLDDARTLNVTQTPEFFVNGKPLPSFGYEQLKSLVDNEIMSKQR